MDQLHWLVQDILGWFGRRYLLTGLVLGGSAAPNGVVLASMTWDIPSSLAWSGLGLSEIERDAVHPRDLRRGDVVRAYWHSSEFVPSKAA